MILARFLTEVIQILKGIHVMGSEAKQMSVAISTLQTIVDTIKNNEKGGEKDADHDKQGKEA